MYTGIPSIDELGGPPDIAVVAEPGDVLLLVLLVLLLVLVLVLTLVAEELVVEVVKTEEDEVL